MSAYIDNLPDLSQGYCVIDAETTGLDRERDRVIEVCVVVHRPFDKDISRTALVASVPQVSEEITRITGIDTATLNAQGAPPERIYPAVFAMPELHTLPVVGHNIVGFDRQFLLNEAKRVDLDCYAAAAEALAPHRLVDTGGLYKGICLGEPPRPGENHYEWVYRVLEIRASGLYWNLTAAAQAYAVSIPRGALHRARTDAIICQRLLEKILETQEVNDG